MAIQNIWVYASTYSGGGGAEPVSKFKGLAPNLYDGSVGDTSTGYSISVSGLCSLWALFDLSTSPVIVDHFAYKAALTGGGGPIQWWGSNDGLAWTSLGGGTASSSGTVTNSIASGSRIAYQYYQVQIYIAGGGATTGVSLTDCRLYDSTSTLITFANAAPLQPAYYYDIRNQGSSGNISSTAPASQYLPDIYDYLSDANSATGYSIAGTTNAHASGLIDLGTAPPAVTGFSATLSAPSGTNGIVQYSDDGITWTQAGTNITTTGSTQTASQSFSAQTHRYWTGQAFGTASGTYAIDEFALSTAVATVRRRPPIWIN